MMCDFRCVLIAHAYPRIERVRPGNRPTNAEEVNISHAHDVVCIVVFTIVLSLSKKATIAEEGKQEPKKACSQNFWNSLLQNSLLEPHSNLLAYWKCCKSLRPSWHSWSV